MKNIKLFLFILINLGFLVSNGLQAAPEAGSLPIEKSEVIGTWLLSDTDGKPFLSVLREDGSSMSNWQGGEVGRWKIDGHQVEITWTDGWNDIFRKDEKGFQHSGFAPGVALTEKPTKTAAATKLEKVSSDILGTWVFLKEGKEIMTMTYRPDHTFGVDVSVDGIDDISGIYNVVGNKLSLKDITGNFHEKCKAVNAIYTFEVADGWLHYQAQGEDACPGRAIHFKLPWNKK